MKKTLLKTAGIIFTMSTLSFANSKPLIVGMELAYPPFEMTDAKGNPTGFSVDLANDLGVYLNRPIKIENMSYGGLIPALMTQKIDIILSSMTITEERQKSINFSDPYAQSHLSFLTAKKSNIKAPNDLNENGRKIAVKKGTTGHIVATQFFPKAEILVFDKETAAVLEVTLGKVDAFIYDPLTVLKNWKDNPNTTAPLLTQFQEKPESWGIGYRKADAELGNQINTFLKEYREKGGFEKLGDKYLNEQKKAFKEQNIPFFF